MQSMMKYVKDSRGRKIGMLLACPVETNYKRIVFGWSRCKAGDAFDRAEGMAQAHGNLGDPVPPSFEKAARAFRVQCVEHFDTVESFQAIEVADYPKQPKAVKPAKTVRNGGHFTGCMHPQHPDQNCTCLVHAIMTGNKKSASLAFVDASPVFDKLI